jgi:hypothetical protein
VFWPLQLNSKVSGIPKESQVPLFGSVSFILTLSQSRVVTSCLYSFNCLSCGDVICGIVAICLTTCTIVGTVDGSTLALMIFYALKFVLSCSFFILEPKAPPSSTLFFFLKTLLRKSVVVFFLFSSVIYISSLVLLTLAGGFYGLSFWCTNRY